MSQPVVADSTLSQLQTPYRVALVAVQAPRFDVRGLEYEDFVRCPAAPAPSEPPLFPHYYLAQRQGDTSAAPGATTWGLSADELRQRSEFLRVEVPLPQPTAGDDVDEHDDAGDGEGASDSKEADSRRRPGALVLAKTATCYIDEGALTVSIMEDVALLLTSFDNLVSCVLVWWWRGRALADSRSPSPHQVTEINAAARDRTVRAGYLRIPDLAGDPRMQLLGVPGAGN